MVSCTSTTKLDTQKTPQQPPTVKPDNVPVIAVVEKPATAIPYRNELPGLELYQKEWTSLIPL